MTKLNALIEITVNKTTACELFETLPTMNALSFPFPTGAGGKPPKPGKFLF